MSDYLFRPMTADDLPTIQRWLSAPAVAEWWHDAAEQFELVSGDLGHPDMAQFIVATNGRDFAYLQCYNLSAWNAGFGAQPPARVVWTSLSVKATCSVAATDRLLFGPSRIACCRPELRVSSSILRRATRVQFAPMKRQDLSAIGPWIHRMDQHS